MIPVVEVDLGRDCYYIWYHWKMSYRETRAIWGPSLQAAYDRACQERN